MKVQSPSGRLVEAVQVDFDADAEPWATYTLSDGSVIKVRVTLKNVLRLEGEFDQGGNPVYMVGTDAAMRVVKSKIRGEPTAQTKSKPLKDDPAVG